MAEFEANVSGRAHVERLIQAEYYNEALRPPAEPTFPQFVGVPGRNPNFVGRIDELAALGPGEAGVATVIAQIATGMGGIGKTTLAIEHCHRVRQATDVVRWLNAEDRQTLVTEYVRIAPAIGVDTNGLEIEDAVARVRSWFETTERSWLLVLDNAETPDALDQLVPGDGNGRVLVTTRHQDWSRTGAHVLRIGVLPPDDAVALLTTLTARDPGPEAEALAEHLGYLALAVEQAAAFCRQTGWPFAQYQQHIEQRSAEILSRNPAGVRRPDGQDITVLTVWDSSIERATAESEGARNLLDVLAHLAPDHVPRALLAADDEPLLRDGDPLYIDAALAALARYSLVDLHRADTGEILTVSTHRLVQEVTRLATQGNAPCATAIRLLRRVFPADPADLATWPLCQVLEPHVTVATAHADRLDTELAAASWLLDRRGTYLHFSGEPRAAPAGHERAVSLYARIAGPDDVVLLIRQANLATSYQAAGRLPEAIDLHDHVLAECERICGRDDLETIRARANVASAYWSAGRMQEAIHLEEKVLADRERVLGDDHADTVAARANLASSYSSAGRTADAIALEEQVLADWERLFGPHHPDTLRARGNLAYDYRSAGRTIEAIALEEQVLADRERLLGPDHPDTLWTRGNLAASYWTAGRTVEGTELMERTLVGQERVLGHDHRYTLMTRGNVALCYLHMGRKPEAVTLMEQVLWDGERVLGPDHPHVLTAGSNLAHAYWSAGRTTEALVLLEEAVVDSERVLGPEHPDTRNRRRVLEDWGRETGPD